MNDCFRCWQLKNRDAEILELKQMIADLCIKNGLEFPIPSGKHISIPNEVPDYLQPDVLITREYMEEKHEKQN